MVEMGMGKEDEVHPGVVPQGAREVVEVHRPHVGGPGVDEGALFIADEEERGDVPVAEDDEAVVYAFHDLSSMRML
jgi:hypothetical protein